MGISYSKINPINDGVLVCVDEEKDLYKYYKLEDVKIGKITLGKVFKNYDSQISNLEKRIKKLENWKKPAAKLLTELAKEGED